MMVIMKEQIRQAKKQQGRMFKIRPGLPHSINDHQNQNGQGQNSEKQAMGCGQPDKVDG